MTGSGVYGFEANEKFKMNGKQVRILQEVVVDDLKALKRQKSREVALICVANS
jgi:hypothetical protein